MVRREQSTANAINEKHNKPGFRQRSIRVSKIVVKIFGFFGLRNVKNGSSWQVRMSTDGGSISNSVQNIFRGVYNAYFILIVVQNGTNVSQSLIWWQTAHIWVKQTTDLFLIGGVLP
jgi:hypothetical protein